MIEVLEMKGRENMSDFIFKKKYGQNFLQNKNIVRKIALVATVSSNSLIIEVGPGSGNLTSVLAGMYRDSNILAYEVDNSLEEILYREIKDYSNIDVLFNDFLKADIVNDIKKYNYDNLYFISNVPYYITTPILFKLIDSNLIFEKIVMMVQKEVGERFCSEISKKEYSALTVILNYYFNVKKEFIVDRNQFYPKPNVDSVVVSFTNRKDKEKLIDREFFLQLVHDSFQYKRKTIRNNLKKYDLNRISLVLGKYGYDLNVRAEALPYYVFVDISNALS